MTTIVYDHNKKQIACDSRCCHNDMILTDDIQKFRFHETGLYFFSGSVADIDQFLKADRTAGVKHKTAEKVSVLVIRNGVVYECGFDDEDGYWEIECTFNIALGTGAKYAIAALDCGFTAKDAVQIAANRDLYTGGKIHLFDVI